MLINCKACLILCNGPMDFELRRHSTGYIYINGAVALLQIPLNGVRTASTTGRHSATVQQHAVRHVYILVTMTTAYVRMRVLSPSSRRSGEGLRQHRVQCPASSPVCLRDKWKSMEAHQELVYKSNLCCAVQWLCFYPFCNHTWCETRSCPLTNSIQSSDG